MGKLSKKKKIALKIFLSIFAIIFLIIAGILIYVFSIYQPSLTIDASSKNGKISDNASGYLYGIAEEGVPSANICESVDISTVSAKVIDGLQHPIGDVDNVSSQLDSCDYIVVYLQDAYDTWYYKNDEIMTARQNGTYDYEQMIKNDFLPIVREQVEKLTKKGYGNKIVYCLYNECDNGIWFGDWVNDKNNENGFGGYCTFNEQGKENFYNAWKLTYDEVKKINPDALIGGPGYYEYDSSKENEFLTFCSQNDCVPQVMIYHELSDNSIYNWQKNVKDYRNIEKSLGIDELPIIVTEYGRMQDNGLPGEMLKYVTQIETTKVYGDNAYWRLANNLCDVAADDNNPNSNWWLYRWYTDMNGEVLSSTYSDLFNSNFAKSVKTHTELLSKGFMGISTISDDETQIEILAGGTNGRAKVELENLDLTKFDGKSVHIKIEESKFKGLSGAVYKPLPYKEYDTKVRNGKLNIQLNQIDESSVYHIIVTAVEEDAQGTSYSFYDSIKRFEFEDGELLGNAYTYDSAYATTGETCGMVGGIEKDGDGVQLDFDIKTEQSYSLDIIYGNSNDGEKPDDRTDSTVILEINGKETEVTLPNTIKSEYTDCYTIKANLKAGQNTIKVTHKDGTIVLDSVVVTPSIFTTSSINVLDDKDRTTDSNKSFLVLVGDNGYYKFTLSDGAKHSVTIDDAQLSSTDEGHLVTYLRKGLNYVDIDAEKGSDLTISVITSDDNENIITLEPDFAKLGGSATLSINKKKHIEYLDKISSKSGTAKFNAKANKSGAYRVTLTYANNDEGGVHDYNVDLIERYVTFTVNSKSQNVYCRNTYSWDTYKTVTFNVQLNKGNNEIIISNNGEKKFNKNESFAPYISKITLNPA